MPPRTRPFIDAVDDDDYIEQVKKIYADQINPGATRLNSDHPEDAKEEKKRKNEEPLSEDEGDRLMVLPDISFNQFREAMYQGQGFRKNIADILGIRLYYVNKVLEKFHRLYVEIQEFEERRLDEAEEALMVQIRLGNPKMIAFLLSTKGKGRGYTDKIEKRELEPPKLRIMPAEKFLEIRDGKISIE